MCSVTCQLVRLECASCVSVAQVLLELLASFRDPVIPSTQFPGEDFKTVPVASWCVVDPPSALTQHSVSSALALGCGVVEGGACVCGHNLAPGVPPAVAGALTCCGR